MLGSSPCLSRQVLGSAAFEIRSTLGAGAMGEVYRGLDRKLNRSVAIKLLAGIGLGCMRTWRG